MIKLSKKSLLLFVVAAVSMASASSASAANFDGIGDHQLRSTNLGFTSATLGGGANCTTSDFTVNVPTGGATATVVDATFSGCTGTGTLAGTTVDATATNLPWEITTLGVAGQFRIDGIHITNNVTGVGHITLEGNLDGSVDCTTHMPTFANSGGLTATSALGNGAATVSGTFTDSLNSLCVT